MKKRILFLIRILLSILFILLLGTVIVCLIPIKSNTIARIAVIPLEKKFQKKIKFDSSRIWLPAVVSLEGVSIIDESGKLYYFNTIDIRYNIGTLILKREFLFDLKGIKLYQNVELLDSVADMLVISKMPDVKFEQIKGTLQLYKDAIFIKYIHAYNDKMHIRGSGWIDKSGSLNCNISFSFSEDVIDKVPDVVREVLLREEGKGWMGIRLKALGNYKEPSLHISGDRIKLNIMEEVFRAD